MGVGEPPPLQQLCSYPGVLEAAGAITAHHRDLGLIRVQRLDLKAVFRRRGCGGGVAPSPMLQEGGAPVSAWLCGIFQTLQAEGAARRVSQRRTLKLQVSPLSLAAQPALPPPRLT